MNIKKHQIFAEELSEKWVFEKEITALVEYYSCEETSQMGSIFDK